MKLKLIQIPLTVKSCKTTTPKVIRYTKRTVRQITSVYIYSMHMGFNNYGLIKYFKSANGNLYVCLLTSRNLPCKITCYYLTVCSFGVSFVKTV